MVLSFDELGPLNVLPISAKRWALVISRKKTGSTASLIRRRVRAT